MARDIDRLLRWIDESDIGSPTEKLVLKRRIEPRPTQQEIDDAHDELYPSASVLSGQPEAADR